MTNKVWMVGMMLIAFLIGMMFSQNTTAQQGEIGRYQITATQDEHGTATGWRLDTRTGQLWYCNILMKGCLVLDREAVGYQ